MTIILLINQYFFTHLNKTSPNNGILLEGILIPNWNSWVYTFCIFLHFKQFDNIVLIYAFFLS